MIPYRWHDVDNLVIRPNENTCRPSLNNKYDNVLIVICNSIQNQWLNGK